MEHASTEQIRGAEVVLPCVDIDPTLAFFTERLGFRLESIFPADKPAVAVVTGHGLRLRLATGPMGAPGGAPACLRISCDDPEGLAGEGLAGEDGSRELAAPNGTRIELVHDDPSVVLTPVVPSFVLTRASDTESGSPGRAGMHYRDLIPDRQGGHVIASRISIDEGGPVPDYVHFHRVHFQMIYCARGWVKVAYEDQGEPIVMHAGDCVVQPPLIRHRVLECSDGLQVVELTAPAEHPTFADPSMELPTGQVLPERRFGGQRFHFHQARTAEWRPRRRPGFEARDIGTGDATGGVAQVHVIRGAGPEEPAFEQHDADVLFLFVLRGEVDLTRREGETDRLRTGDAVSLPRGLEFGLGRGSSDLELLEVVLGPSRA